MVAVSVGIDGPAAVVTESIGVSLCLAPAKVHAAGNTLEREEHVFKKLVLVRRDMVQKLDIARRLNSVDNNGSIVRNGSVKSGALDAGDLGYLVVSQHITNRNFLGTNSLIIAEKHVLVGDLKGGQQIPWCGSEGSQPQGHSPSGPS